MTGSALGPQIIKDAPESEGRNPKSEVRSQSTLKPL